MKRHSQKKTSFFNPIIIIGRQFASGGRHVGKIVADRLGIDYYDTELLSEAAEKLGFSRHIFDIHDEKPPSQMRSLLQGVFGLADNFHDVSICSERMYIEQGKVIKEICEKGPCVIVGRTADFIMRNHPGLVSIFLHAPLEKRAEIALRRGDAPNYTRALELAKKYDRERENYYNFYTGTQSWGKANNYDLTIDSSVTGLHIAAELIIKLVENKFKGRLRTYKRDALRQYF